ncbi:MAG TPA: hypothetical protein VGK67_00795 [Myxococcales bacterium]
MGLGLALMVWLGAAGCATSTGASAGVAYTKRGAETEVPGEVDAVEQRAQVALHDQGITVAASQTSPAAAERVLEGMKGDVTVTVTITKTDDEAFTHVEVVAQKNPVEWDKDLARRIAQQIAAA